MFTNANLCYKPMPYMNNYVNLGGYQIKVSNESGLLIVLKLKYSLAGMTNEVTSPNIEYGSQYSTELPDKSSRITIILYDNSNPEDPTIIYTIPLFYPRNACYHVSGTSSSSSVKEVPCSSLNSSQNIYNNCCCCCMCNCKQ